MKSTTQDGDDAFEMTTNEWETAIRCHAGSEKAVYVIVRVARTASQPQIMDILVDPVQLHLDGVLDYSSWLRFGRWCRKRRRRMRQPRLHLWRSPRKRKRVPGRAPPPPGDALLRKCLERLPLLGRIENFDVNRGFGFVATGGRSLFFHVSGRLPPSTERVALI